MSQRNDQDIEVQIRVIAAQVDVLLDVDLKRLDRIHADRLAAIGNRLLEGARAIRVLRPRPQDSVGYAADALVEGTAATLKRPGGGWFGGRRT